jgi:hypothetical protein
MRSGVGFRSHPAPLTPRKVVHMGSVDDLDVPTWQRKRQAEGTAEQTPPVSVAGDDKYDIPAFLRKHAH